MVKIAVGLILITLFGVCSAELNYCETNTLL